MAIEILAGAVALQIVAGLLRVRAWFHCLRATSSAPSRDVRFRDLLAAHLGGTGFGFLLPPHGSDALKVALLRRRTPSLGAGTVAATLVPMSLVEALFTVSLTAALLAAGVVSPGALAGHVPPAARTAAVVALVAVAILAVVLLRRRAPRIVRDLRAGLEVLRRPALLMTRVVPWQVAARVVRFVALAALLGVAGIPLALGPALVLMALQGTTPTVGPASSAMRAGVIGTAFHAAHGASYVAPVGQVLVAASVGTCGANLAISLVAMAILLRTASPRRIVSYARSACRRPAFRAA